MGEVIANVPTAGNKARAGLSKEESVRFFGPPPLITGEDLAQYEAMRDQISAAVGPLDFLEEILVNDVVNLVWETLRLRRLMANLLNGDNGEFLTKMFALRIATIEHIDRMVAGAEARRNVALREGRPASRDSGGSTASAGRGPGCQIQGTTAPFDRRRGGA
jgi:hypothetical protein